jgi:TPP-dependent pyruvate/acetoin dehydrogenase alpha subunit
MERDAERAAEAAVRFAEAAPYPDASELLRHVV